MDRPCEAMLEAGLDVRVFQLSPLQLGSSALLSSPGPSAASGRGAAVAVSIRLGGVFVDASL